MTNYNRFISYLNYYELGNKKGNVGFARVETSDEICKVTVHCALKVIPKKECKVYLLRRQTSFMLSKEVGVTEVKDGLLDVKLSYPNGLIDNEGFVFKDCIGILLMYSKDNYIGAKWDGSNITYHEAGLIEQSNQPFKMEPMEDSRNTQTSHESTKMQEPVKIGSNIQVVPKSEVVVIEDTTTSSKKVPIIPDVDTSQKEVKDEFSESNEKSDSNRSEVKVEPSSTDTIKNNINPIEIKKETGKVEHTASTTREDIHFAYQRESDTSTQEKKIAEVSLSDVSDQKDVQEQELIGRSFTVDLSKLKEQESIKEEFLPPTEEEQEEDDMISMASGCASGMNPWVDHPTARSILNRFVRMYPFDDGEMAECVRLEPKDIGLLPMSAWVLGNNSFVLHSYSSFRHLLFAKKLTREGCEYYLMVPGFYTYREKQLAQMFGFEMFKGSRRRGPKGGEFGYWYVKILFE